MIDGIRISESLDELDLDRVHGWLSTAYWCAGIPRAVVEKAARGSMVFGAFAPGAGQVGYARVVSDRATFAWLCDVIVDPAWRGRGVGVALVGAIVAHAELQGLRRFLLATLDAHGLYRRFGFTASATPERWMERVDREVYTRVTPAATPRPSTSTP